MFGLINISVCLILASESRYKGSTTPSVRSSVVNRKDEASAVITVNALCSLHCFDFDGWVTQGTSEILLGMVGRGRHEGEPA